MIGTRYRSRNMRSVEYSVAIGLLLLSATAGAREQLVLPPQMKQLAEAHHCKPVSKFVYDGVSREAAPFDFEYEWPKGKAKALLAAWCEKPAASARSDRRYSLVILAERPDQPLHMCPDEIPNVRQIGRPQIFAAPMIPHDFVVMGIGERLPVTEPRIMFGVINHLPGRDDYYACVVGRWAYYSRNKNR